MQALFSSACLWLNVRTPALYGYGIWKETAWCIGSALADLITPVVDQDADLEIGLRFSTKFNVPYYRLYAVVNGESHFLIDRGEKEIQQLARFISFHTGWRGVSHHVQRRGSDSGRMTGNIEVGRQFFGVRTDKRAGGHEIVEGSCFSPRPTEGVSMTKSRRKRTPKTVLRLPDLEQSKSAVLNSLTSASSQRSYDHAIREFIDWYCSEPRLAFNKTVVTRYRISLEQRQYAPSTSNLRLAAVPPGRR